MIIRETVNLKISKSFKKEAMSLIDKTIKSVDEKFNFKLTDKEVTKIKNLSIDQVNVNVSQKAKTKTLWVFDVEELMPIIVEKDSSAPRLSDLTPKQTDAGLYKMKPNLIWTFNENNRNEEGLTRMEFENKVLDMILEDFETASFYGALSYITESDTYEQR